MAALARRSRSGEVGDARRARRDFHKIYVKVSPEIFCRQAIRRRRDARLKIAGVRIVALLFGQSPPHADLSA
jgi:hypothetical protein